jgi:hypothetical protein
MNRQFRASNAKERKENSSTTTSKTITRAPDHPALAIQRTHGNQAVQYLATERGRRSRPTKDTIAGGDLVSEYVIGAAQENPANGDSRTRPQQQNDVESEEPQVESGERDQSTPGEGLGQVREPYFVHFSHEAPPQSPDHSDPNPGPPGANRAGYTRVRLKPRMTVAWETGQSVNTEEGSQVPLYVQSANIFFQLHSIQVSISSTYEAGSCPYRVTRDHEYEHVHAFLRIFREHRETMVQRVNGIPLPTEEAPRLVPENQVGAEQNRTMEPVVRAIREVQETIRATMEADRRARDAPSAYERVYRQCSSEEWEGQETPNR